MYAQVNILTPDTTICPGNSLQLEATIGSSAGNFIIFTDDVYSATVEIGFPFSFFGTTYNQLIISSNGYVKFDTGEATDYSNYIINTGVPGNVDVLNSAFCAFTDIDPSVGGSIEYSVQGVAPNRRFVVTFCDVPMYSCNTLIAKMQLVLFEDGHIEYHLANKPTCATWNSGAAIQGVQNATGTVAVVTPGRNFPGTWTAANDGKAFTPSGGTYVVSTIPFQFFPTGLNNITWYQGASTTAIGTGNTITVTPTANTFYRAVAQGCIGTSTDTVNVTLGNTTPAPGVVSPVTYCQGATATPLTATGTNLLWYTVPTGGTPLAGAPTPNTSAAGTTTYYVSQTLTNCESPRAAIVVNITGAGVHTDTTAICIGDTVYLGTQVITTPGTYTDTFSTGIGCDSIQILTVTAAPPPAPPTVTSPLIYCAGSPAAQLTATGANVLWYTSATGGTGSATAPTPSTGVAGTTTYYVSQTVNGCESLRDSIVVNVFASPNVTVNPPAIGICPGGSALLVASGAGTYAWSPAAGLNAVSGANVIAGPTATTTYTVVGTLAVSATVSCSDTATVTVTVNPNPTVSASSNSPVCSGETLELYGTSDPGASFAWTGPMSYSSNLQNPTRSPAVGTMSGTYTLVATLNGCSSTTTTQATVLPVPISNTTIFRCAGETYTFNGVTYGISGTYADTFSTVAGCDSITVLNLTVAAPVPPPGVTTPVQICQGADPTALTATGTNLLWYTTPTGGSASGAPPVPPTTTVGSTTYYVSQTIGTCEGPRAAIEVQIKYTPPAPAAITPAPYCQNEPATQLSAAGTDLLWYTGSGTSAGSAVPPTPSTAAAGTFNFYVTQTESGCESPRTPVPVVVKPTPPARILIDHLPVCVSDTSIFTAFDPGTGTAYTWNFPAEASVLSGSDGGPYEISWARTGTFPVRLLVERLGCVDSTVMQVQVIGPQTPDFLLPPYACEDQIVDLTAGEIVGFLPGFGYQWNFDGASIKSGAAGGPYTLSWSEPGPKVVSLVLSGNGCPSAPLRDTILIRALPAARIARPVDNKVCAGDTMTLRVDDPFPTASYRWSPAAFFEQQDSGVVIHGRIYTTDYVVLTATSAFGCEATDSVKIDTHPCCELMIPTAFSPNGDGRNDRFRALSQGFHHNYELRVFNRWGQVLFMSQSQNEGWDGMYNGVPQDPGVYFYRIQYDCADGEVMDRAGDVMLVR